MNFEANLSANRGEWAEIYTMFKLLSDGKLYAADENMNKNYDVFLPILSVIREEVANIIYNYLTGDKIRIFLNQEFLLEVDAEEFARQAEKLFKAIQKGKGAAFSVPETEKFMVSIFVNKVKQPSTQKADILLKIQEINSGMILESGFSIKSNFKAKAHLVNSSQATNFIYEINGFSDAKMDAVNMISTDTKIQKRMNYIMENSDSVIYDSPARDTAKRNLMLVDSALPSIIGFVLYCHYFENISTCEDITNALGTTDPLQFDNPLMYSYKMKKFLCACALGMNFGSNWSGVEEVNGGYIIVKEDGDIVAYHNYNRNVFETFLLKETKIERGSTKRHNFANVYKNNGKYYVNLNLAVRFK